MSKTTTAKKWTVLAWIAGDNNLDSYGLSDINEMKGAVSMSMSSCNSIDGETARPIATI